MDPFTIGLGILNIGSSIFGSITGSDNSKKEAELKSRYSDAMYQQDLKVNSVRRQAMELTASRQQMEILRNQQRTRALALSSATTQGAQFGTGLQGGFGEIAGQSNVNWLGVNQNLLLGRQMFDINEATGVIKNQYQKDLASLGADAAADAGLASLGKSIGGLGSLGLFKGFGSGSNGSGSLQTYGQFLNSIGSNGIY